jgi:branched-chain amino acid transport system permease protein
MIFGLNLGIFQQIPLFQENPAISVIFNGLLIVLVIMFYPGGLIRLVNKTYLKLKVFSKKLYQKWRVYRYGTDN